MNAKAFSSKACLKVVGVRQTVPFPHIDPVLVHIGPFAIRWYALAYIATILLGWRYVVGMVRNQKLWTHRAPPADALQIDDLILWLTLGVIVGGRLGYILFYSTSTIWTNPIGILKTWEGGMSFHGGALGVVIAGLLFTRAKKLDALRLGDLIVAAEPIGGFLVRIANFINGELWGRPTTVPWAMVFPDAGPLPRHPSQLYEAALEGLLLFAVLRWGTHGAKLLNRRGVVLGMFLTGYGLIRIALENVRQPDAQMPIFPFGLTMGMMLSIPMLLAGLFLIWRGMREPLPPALALEQPPSAPLAAKGADEPA
jgi:phosphatidylglycerol:prolipoprotein diacylglycerol transferase